MPGIAGIISKQSSKECADKLTLMLGCMMHEPFYASGRYINEQLSLYAGWVCHSGSFSDCMPVFNERRDLVLLFSGEIFADKGLTDQLKKNGHEFDSSNASYVIHMYEEKGKEFLKDLNGWFSGILIDLGKKELLLFNDRYGMHRIYYHESEYDFIFSSEAKALLKIKPELRKIDMRSLGEFFACDCVLDNRSLFSNIFLLPGGSAWTFRNDENIKKDSYFQPSDWEGQPVIEEGNFYNKLRETFCRILPYYFSGTQPIAMSLTSGLDTRVIMSCMDHTNRDLPCYTFSGMFGETFDVRIARKVAETCSQKHHVIRLDETFCSSFQSLAEKTVYITDGCHDICGSHDVYFNSFARNFAPIRMTGKFGSEVLGSNSMFNKTIRYRTEVFHPDFKKHFDEAVDAFNESRKGHKLSFAVFKEMPWHEYGRLHIEMSKLTVRTPYMDNDLVGLMYQAPLGTRASREIRLQLIEDGNPLLRKIMTDRGTAGEFNYLVSRIAQVLCYSLFKGEYVYLYQLPHWMARVDYAFASLHPERLLAGRYQLGHYRLWFRDELSHYIREVLLDTRAESRSYLNGKSLKKIVDGHVRGMCNYTLEINKIVTSELIHRLLIENI